MSTLLGPVTDNDLRRWQMQRHALLGKILQHGHDHDLPVLAWRITQHALFGEAAQVDMGARRAAFEAWVGSLELIPWDEHVHGSGLVHLHATRDDLWGHRIKVGVIADLLPDEGTA